MITKSTIMLNPETLRQNGEIKARRNRIIMGATTLVAGAAATLVLAKKGKLNPVEGGNKVLEAVKAVIKKPADKVLNFIAGSKTIATVVEGIGKAQAKVAPKFQKVTTKATELKDGARKIADNIADSQPIKKAGAVAQETRCKLSSLAADAKTGAEGIIADAETFVANAEGSIKGFTQKASTKKAVAFVKDIPSKVSTLAGEAKEKIASLAGKIFKKGV